MKSFAVTVLFVSIGVALSGCVAGEEPEGASPQEVFTRTVVRFDAEGNQQVAVEYVTREEQLDEIAAREQADARRATARAAGLGEAPQAITRDTGCAGSSLWIYDRADRAGNQICFFGAGDAYFGDYTRLLCSSNYQCFQLTWIDATRSYWPGSENGYFEGRTGDLYNDVPFSAWGPPVNASYWAAHSRAVHLTD